MENYKYEVMGISFNDLKPLDELFEEVMDCGEEVIYQTKKTYQHREEGLNFDYKYAIDCVVCDGKTFYSLELVVMPNTCCVDYINGVMDCCGIDDIADVELSDIISYGGGSVMFGSETEDSEEWNEELLNKIASVVDTMDALRGFYIDKAWNMIGTTGWDTINHCVNNEKLFKF